jgi:hypothetical protein
MLQQPWRKQRLCCSARLMHRSTTASSKHLQGMCQETQAEWRGGGGDEGSVQQTMVRKPLAS